MTDQLAPRVSVIIPAYNSELYLAATLNSVLQQSCLDYEVIVVDDGSTDGTWAAVRAAGGAVSYIHQANQGPSRARNTGIAAAKGEFICFLDADDLWTADKLRIQLDYMDRNPQVGLLFGDADEFDDAGVACASLVSTSRFFPEIAAGGPIAGAFQKLLVENFIPTSTVMIRTSCFETAGLFDPALKGPEDRDMWSRLAVYFPVAYVPALLARKRAVAASVSRNVETTLRSRVRLWHKARDLFPELAPSPTVNALLTPTYVQLGYLLLNKNETGEARDSALKALRIARQPKEWLLAAALLLFSFTGRGVADSAFRAKRWLARIASRGLPRDTPSSL